MVAVKTKLSKAELLKGPPPDVWASESQSAFQWKSEAQIKAEVKAAAHEARILNRRLGGLRRSGKGVLKRSGSNRAGRTSDENDWVFVQTSDRSVSLSDSKACNDVVVVPSDVSPVAAAVSKDTLHAPLVTREMTDTEFNRVFKRPLPHMYGRGNIRPVSNSDYMKTFNMKAAEESCANVFESSFRAKDLHEELKAHDYDIMECLEDSIGDDSEEPVAGVECSEAAPPPVPEVFGRKSKDRTLEPSMFEILTWG